MSSQEVNLEFFKLMAAIESKSNDVNSLIQQPVPNPDVDPSLWSVFFDTWLGLILGVAGLVYSALAYSEAKKAKAAATEAGKSVKIQTITIELTEISQRLDILDMKIDYSSARDLINEVSRKLRRLVSPFQSDKEFGETIIVLKDALNSAKDSLSGVRPALDKEEIQPEYTVYNAIEGELSTINGLVADLLGLFEKRTIDFGDKNGNT
jgi:hypothetical protein